MGTKLSLTQIGEVLAMDFDYIEQGDCLELMKKIPDGCIDMILCDPPYGINYVSKRRIKSKAFAPLSNDKYPAVSFIPDMLKKLKPTGAAYIFARWDTQQAFIDAIEQTGRQVKSVIVWDKGNHSAGDLRRAYGNRYESIIFSPGPEFIFPGKRPVNIVSYPRIHSSKLVHPTEKPVGLLEKLILDCTKEGDVILDPTMGSGSTCVAAINTGRHYIGFELDSQYFEIACQRLDEDALTIPVRKRTRGFRPSTSCNAKMDEEE